MVFAGSISLSAQEMTSKKEVKQSSNISEVTLSCNQDCNNCSDKVKKQLAYTKGVKFVSTDFEKDIVTIKYRNDRTDVDKLIASLAEVGYAAKPLPKKGCCPGKTAEGDSHSGCSGKTTGETHSGCSGKTTGETQTGCSGKTTGESHSGCSGKTTEPVKK